MTRSKDKMGQFLIHVGEFYKSHLRAPLDLNAAPIRYSALARNQLAKLTSNTLFEHKMQIRGLTHTNTSASPAQFLSSATYQEEDTRTNTINLTEVDFVKTQSNGTRRARNRASNRQRQTKSFDFFAKAVKNKELLCNLIETPVWFSEISCGIANIPYRPLRLSETLEIVEKIDMPTEPHTMTGPKTVLLYTDGSMYDQPKTIGSGCLLIEKRENEEDVETEYWSKPTQHNASSTKAEKWAILHGLEQCNNEVKLSIYTDSLSSINAIQIMSRNPSAREIIKFDDFAIVEKIHHELKRFDNKPSIHWVKSHSDDPSNNAVDRIAKAACGMDLPITDVTPYKTGIDNERDFHIHVADTENNIERLDRYPSSFVRQERIQFLKERNIERLARKWPEYEVDYEMTTAAVCSSLDRKNHLDCSNQRAHSFRINVLGQNLQTFDKLNRYNFWMSNCEDCIFCGEPETNKHIWECSYTKENFASFIAKTLEYALHETEISCKKRKVDFSDSTKMAVEAAIKILFRYIPEEDKYDTESFLGSPEARGIIEKTLPTMFHQLPEELEAMGAHGTINIKSEKWLAITLVAAWNRALYDLWWRPRSSKIHKNERRIVKRRETRRKAEEKKAHKNITAAASRAIKKAAIKNLKEDRAEAKDLRRTAATSNKEDVEEPTIPTAHKRPRRDPAEENPHKKRKPNVLPRHKPNKEEDEEPIIPEKRRPNGEHSPGIQSRKRKGSLSYQDPSSLERATKKRRKK
jgi:ribonuclease HI